MASIVHLQLDKLVLTATTGLAWTAFYELGQKAARGFQMLPLMLTEVTMPAVSEIDVLSGRAEVRRLYQAGLRYVVLATVPLVGLAAVAAPSIVRLWLGSGYGWAAASLAVMVVVFGSHALTGMGTAVARGLGHPEIEMRARLGMAVCHLVLALSLVPRFGLAGALAGLAASGIGADLYYLSRLHRLLEQPLGRAVRELVAKPLACTLAGCAAAALVGLQVGPRLDGRAGALAVLMLQAGAFLLVLVPGLLATAALRWEDVRRVGSLVRAGRRVGGDAHAHPHPPADASDVRGAA